ncbi:MAG: hypothetical protein IJK64_09850 [Clostridia bacterium]|nr:hypothetical protein [Clostridia bacterium]
MTKAFSALFTLIYTFLATAGMAGGTGSWALDLPAYEGGRLCDAVYLDGSGILSDAEGPVGTESRMELIQYTTAEQYTAYCESLADSGYEAVYADATDSLLCNAFRKDGKFYYTYFTVSKNEARVIEDNNTRSFEDFGYACSDGAGVTVYQFDYPYADFGAHKDEEIYSTNGMLYLIRLADNRLIVIDGGSIRQSSDQNIDECMKLMREVTGTPEGESVNIALWYGTHGHSDHVTFFYKLLGYYHNEINLERVMFNYPSLSLIEHDERIDMYRDRLNALYPDVKYLCPHTGMRFRMGNAEIDVLYTQEDAVNARTGETPVTNANDGSLVCRISAAGRRFLVLGDINVLAQQKILEIHEKEALRCDVLQAAHHLYNAVALIYDAADADYVFCPMSEGRAAWLPGNAAARLYYSKSQMLFADNALYSIGMQPDGLTLQTGHTDCVPYDGSSMNGVH